MKRKSLLFKPWKAQAIHESNPEREWQTRRVVPKKIWLDWGYGGLFADYAIEHCPYSVGEEVYIKEKYCHKADPITAIVSDSEFWYFAVNPDVIKVDGDGARELTKAGYEASPWLSSRFMPERAARTVVTITDIQAQRVQDISYEDCLAEGLVHNAFWDMWESPLHPGSLIDWYKTAFKQLWDSIHGEGSWERNDWVWKYSFIRRDYETTESHRDTSSY